MAAGMLKRVSTQSVSFFWLYSHAHSGTLCMTSTQISGADKVTHVTRLYYVNQSSLNYTICMATKQVPQLTTHLTAALVRA